MAEQDSPVACSPPGPESLAQACLSMESSRSFSEERCCLTVTYVVPRRVVRRGLHRLALIHSPTAPDELGLPVLSAALGRFDATFAIPRSDLDRRKIVERLRSSSKASLCWNVDEFLSAFSVQLRREERIFFTVDLADSSTTMSQVLTICMVVIILTSILVWMVGTMPSVCHESCAGCQPEPDIVLQYVDNACVCIFTAEYLVRLGLVGGVRDQLLQPLFVEALLAGEDVRLHSKTRVGRILKFVTSPSSVFDILSVLPFWLEFALSDHQERFTSWLRLCRLFRVSRVFKLYRVLNSDLGPLSDAHRIFASVMRDAFLPFMMTLLLVFVALVVFSAMIYSLERGDWYPTVVLEQEGLPPSRSGGHFLRTLPHGAREVSPFSSIASAAWWTLATITTVGYGDAVPATVGGRLVGAVCMLYGTLLLGLPIGIIGAQFSTEYLHLSERTRLQDSPSKSRMPAQAVEVECVPSNSSGSVTGRASGSSGSSCGCACNQRRELPISWTKSSWRGKLYGISAPNAADATSEVSPASSSVAAGRLRHAQRNFEEVLQLHGDLLGISIEQQQGWKMSLRDQRFSAHPALERLGARILVTVSEAEEFRPGARRAAQQVRFAWHELCIACYGRMETVGPTLLKSKSEHFLLKMQEPVVSL